MPAADPRDGGPLWASRGTTLVRHGEFLPIAGDGPLSELDRGLIRALQLDGRQSYAQLARDLDSNVNAVRRRVGELRERHLIEITTVSDPQVLGYGATAMVGVRLEASRRPSEAARDLATLGGVDYVVVTTGRYDLLVEVLCRDTHELLEVVERDIRSLDGVRGVEIFPYLRLHYQEPQWDAAQRKAGSSGPFREAPELSRLDREIVRELNRDGRVPFAHVAERLEISEAHVRKRFARLTDTGALRVMALTKPSSLGFETMAWLGIEAAPNGKVQDLADRLTALPSIAYLAVCTGRFDILAEVVCRDAGDLVDLLDREVRSLPGVARVEALLCLELYYRPVSPAA